MSTRSKPKNYNEVKQAILTCCVEPKTLAQLTELLSLDRNIVYRAATQLMVGENRYLKSMAADTEGSTKRLLYYFTLNVDFRPELEPKKHMKEVNETTKGARVINFTDNKELQRLQKQTDLLTREMRKSAKTYVGISSIYNG